MATLSVAPSAGSELVSPASELWGCVLADWDCWPSPVEQAARDTAMAQAAVRAKSFFIMLRFFIFVSSKCFILDGR